MRYVVLAIDCDLIVPSSQDIAADVEEHSAVVTCHGREVEAVDLEAGLGAEQLGDLGVGRTRHSGGAR